LYWSKTSLLVLTSAAKLGRRTSRSDMSIPTPFATQRSRLKVQAIQHPTNVNHAYRLTRFWSWALADFLQQTGQLTGAHTPVLAQRIQLFIRTVGKYLIFKAFEFI